MFILIKEFDQKSLIPFLKDLLERTPSLAVLTRRSLKGRPNLDDLREHWRQHDTGWSLATCMRIAERVEEEVQCKGKLFDEQQAFLKAVANGNIDRKIPDLIPIIWVQYAMPYMHLKESPCNMQARLSIWTCQDQAIMVSNQPLSNGAYLVFDPLSGLYSTDAEFTTELNKISDQMKKLESIVCALTGNNPFSPYSSSASAFGLMDEFITFAGGDSSHKSLNSQKS
jgi:hypothetical protein